MVDVLSQSEIDSLLTALSSGELSAEEVRRSEESGRVRAYDFRRAMRFSKDHVRSISRIYEQYARLLATYFAVQLRMPAQVAVETVTQLPYVEFARSLPTETVLHLIDVRPSGGKFLIEVSAEVASALLDRLLGGMGQADALRRKMTEIDLQVLERLFARSLPSLASAWSSVADMRFAYDSLEMNSQFIQIANQTDVVLVVSLSVGIGTTSGMVNVCMPHTVLEPIMPRLTSRFVMAGKSDSDSPQRDLATGELSRHMGHVAVTLRAEVGRAHVRFDQLLGLQPGDVIVLEQPIREELSIRVGEKLTFRGRPGTRRGHYAVCITRAIEDGDEDER